VNANVNVNGERAFAFVRTMPQAPIDPLASPAEPS